MTYTHVLVPAWTSREGVVKCLPQGKTAFSTKGGPRCVDLTRLPQLTGTMLLLWKAAVENAWRQGKGVRIKVSPGCGSWFRQEARRHGMAVDEFATYVLYSSQNTKSLPASKRGSKSKGGAGEKRKKGGKAVQAKTTRGRTQR